MMNSLKDSVISDSKEVGSFLVESLMQLSKKSTTIE